MRLGVVEDKRFPQVKVVELAVQPAENHSGAAHAREHCFASYGKRLKLNADRRSTSAEKERPLKTICVASDVYV